MWATSEFWQLRVAASEPSTAATDSVYRDRPDDRPTSSELRQKRMPAPPDRRWTGHSGAEIKPGLRRPQARTAELAAAGSQDSAP